MVGGRGGRGGTRVRRKRGSATFGRAARRRVAGRKRRQNESLEKIEERKRRARLLRTSGRRSTFMLDRTNRRLVLECLPHMSDEAREVMDHSYQEFSLRRKELMTEEQIEEMNRVVNKVRMSQVLFYIVSSVTIPNTKLFINSFRSSCEEFPGL